MNLYSRFFQTSEDIGEAAAMEEARQNLDWMSSEAHARFLSWVEREASRPFPLDKEGIVANAIRSNTLREVREHIRNLERESSDLAGESNVGA